MPSSTPTSAPGSPVVGARKTQRAITRARVFDAAVAELGRCGLAAADTGVIAAAAGVARGTFYFHFPTKEHVLIELERAEEAKIAAELASRTTEGVDLGPTFSLLVRHVLAAERRLGPVVLRDMLGLHFSPTRPVEDEVGEHPLAEFVVAAITKAHAAGQVARDADPGELGMIFMTGLFALLATGAAPSRARDALLDRYVQTIVHGMEAE